MAHLWTGEFAADEVEEVPEKTVLNVRSRPIRPDQIRRVYRNNDGASATDGLSPSQKRDLTAAVHREANRVYQAYGAARKLWGCRDEEILMEGPAGTGKTRAILEKMHFCAMKYPGFRGLIVRKTRESLTNSVLVTLEEKVIPKDSPILDGPQRRLRQTYHYPNGSEIDVGGMDKS